MPLRFEDDFLKKLEYLHVVSKRAFAGQNRADRLARKRGRGLEFADHRGYSPGDDFRHIDWKAYKRLGRLLLRLFDEEQDLPIYLFIDASQSMREPAKFDQARRIAAALCYIGLAHLDRVTILPFDGGSATKYGPGRGKGRIFRVFELLERDGDRRADRPARGVHAVRVAHAAAGPRGRHLGFPRSARIRARPEDAGVDGPRRLRRAHRLAVAIAIRARWAKCGSSTPRPASSATWT